MGKSRILVVEDESIVGKGIKMSLEDLGYAVTSVVSSGEDAIKKMNEDIPNLVLMDIQLAGEMDGIEAAERIRTVFHLPVVYLTANADKELLERAKISAPFGYLLKPFRNRELHTNIEMALHKHEIEKKLNELVAELQKALAEIKTLQSFLPICSFCKKIRDDDGAWNQLEKYIEEHSDSKFSHSLCPECAKQHYPEFYGNDKS